MHAHVTISVPKAFRVVFSAELDKSCSSDIAIDDVAFSEVYFDSLIKNHCLLATTNILLT
jgi:hypothetical protein